MHELTRLDPPGVLTFKFAESSPLQIIRLLEMNAISNKNRVSRGAVSPRHHATGLLHRRPAISVADHTSSPNENLNISVHADEEKVGEALVKMVQEQAISHIAAKGFFTIAVPGGSVLKMLGGLKTSPVSAGIDWSRVHLCYVNHKCVPVDDKASTHSKARGLFIDGLKLDNFIAVTGGSDPKAEAEAYEAALRSQARTLGTVASNGFPAFDLMLIGMGADGHVGSLYPNAPATTLKSTPDSNWILPVVKAEGSSSITFSHTLMGNSKSIIICCTGAKKAPAVVKALELDPPEGEMPASMIKPLLPGSTVTWLMDSDAAAGLSAAKGIEMIRK